MKAFLEDAEGTGHLHHSEIVERYSDEVHTKLHADEDVMKFTQSYMQMKTWWSSHEATYRWRQDKVHAKLRTDEDVIKFTQSYIQMKTWWSSHKATCRWRRDDVHTKLRTGEDVMGSQSIGEYIYWILNCNDTEKLHDKEI